MDNEGHTISTDDTLPPEDGAQVNQGSSQPSELANENAETATYAESDTSSTEAKGKMPEKSVTDMQALLEKLEKIREEHNCVLGQKYTNKNIRIFVILYCAAIFLQSSISSYLFTVSDHIWRRYAISDFEMDFIHGADKVVIVCSLIFTAYYGNKMNKPLAIMSGSIVFAFGAILCAVPYWDLGARKSYAENKIQTYLDSGLCQVGHDGSDNLTGLSTAYAEQCEYLPSGLHSSENKSAFTILCVAQLLMGLGKAFVLPLGVVYAEEAERKTETPLYISAILLSYSAGMVLGTLFGTWFIIYPEDLKEDLAIVGWEVGAWWVGFPLFGSFLFVISFGLIIFPQWIREPKWLLYRRYRQIKREYRRQKYEQEERRKRRLLKRERKRRERERKNIHAKRNSETVSNGVSESDISNTDTEHESAAEEIAPDNEVFDSDITVTIEKQCGYAHGDSETRAENHSKTLDSYKNENAADQNDASNTSNNSNVQAQENVNSVTSPENSVGVTGAQDDTTERRYKPKNVKKGVRIHESARDREAEEQVKKQWVNDEQKEKRALEKKKLRSKLGRRLKDLPQNLKFLILNPVFTLTSLGVACSFYYVSGNQNRMPMYLIDQFQYEPQEARLITGLVFGFASLLGILVTAIVTYKFEIDILKQFRAVLILSGIICLGPLLSFAFSCKVSYGPIERTDLGALQPSCALDLCDCSVSQFYPVCSKDGTRYHSPCHAGCNVADLRKDGDKQEFVFKECLCLDNGEAAATFCEDECSHGAGYIFFLFITLVLHAMCYTTIVLVFLRFFSEKLRCLTVGFAMWIVYALAITPGTAIYKYCHTTACELKENNCDDNDVCWRVNERELRINTQAATLVFLVVACTLLVASYIIIHKKKIGVPNKADEKKQEQSGEQNDAYQPENSNRNSSSV